MEFDIIIKNVNVEELNDLVSFLKSKGASPEVKEEKPVVVQAKAKKSFACKLCGAEFKHQNGVNSHMKYCDKNPNATYNKKQVVQEEQTKVEEVVKSEPKTATKSKATKVSKKPAKKAAKATKPKPAPKPAFVEPSKADVRKATATYVLSNNDNISTSANIVQAISESLKEAQGESKELNNYVNKSLPILVDNVLRAIEANLGARSCLGMELPDGYSIALFAESGKITLKQLVNVL